MLTKIYLETTNVCNLSCSFCHGTKREKRFMTEEEFSIIIEKIKGRSKYLYLHLMGEPLLNRLLPRFCEIAKAAGFEVMLTTNGTKLSENGSFIYSDGNVKKVSISLQAADMKDGKPSQICGKDFDKYLCDIADFAQKCAENGVICVLRLWNITDETDKEQYTTARLRELFPDKWIKNRSGFKLIDAPRGESEVFLEFGEKFEWPDSNGKAEEVSFCHALRDQIGILCDGTVVPCCLDADGAVALGNIFSSGLDEILSSEKAVRLLESFEKRDPSEKLCKTCGFAKRFK